MSVSDVIIKKLEGEVKEYIENNLYKGFKEQFKFERLDINLCNYLYLKDYVDEKLVYICIKPQRDISCIDKKWEQGLSKIGRRYGVRLSLPPGCYTYI